MRRRAAHCYIDETSDGGRLFLYSPHVITLESGELTYVSLVRCATTFSECLTAILCDHLDTLTTAEDATGILAMRFREMGE